MKKIIKVWDILLMALLGLFAFGCGRSFIEPPPAEYGPPPEYDDIPEWTIENESD